MIQEGNQLEALKYSKRSISISEAEILDARTALGLLGLPVVLANFEADHAIQKLVRSGTV